MRTLLLCGLLLLSSGDMEPTATLPPAETEDVLNAVDVAGWDDFFLHMEETEPWQQPSDLLRRLAEGETDLVQLLAWFKNRGFWGCPAR